MDKALMQNIEKLHQRIRTIVENARNKVYRAANYEMLEAYWQIGKEIVEEEQNGKKRAEYGKYILKDLSLKLTKDYGQGFDQSNLRNIRKFYTVYPKRDSLRHELSWTHYRHLMRIEKNEAREFYKKEAIEGNWNTRQLQRQINSLYYDRLLMSGDKKGLMLDTESKNEIMQPSNIIKDPFVLEFLNVKQDQKLSERELETALIDKLQHFILELGKGFAFVDRQQRITTETGKNFYIDLVFYNYILKCFLLIDLKIDELSHQDVGQMDMYVRMFEDLRKNKDDNPTIGLILCTKKDKTIVKYSVLNENKQIFASKYQMYLPTEKQLQEEIQREKQLIEEKKKLSEE